jgi:hypothetical protein
MRFPSLLYMYNQNNDIRLIRILAYMENAMNFIYI